MSDFRKILSFAVASFLAMAPLPALAQAVTAAEDTAGLFPSADVTTETSAELPDGVETHPPLRLTSDKSEIIRLDRPAANIIVGSPVHANVMMDNPKMLVVVPKLPGATFFTALDKDGKVVMQRHVIVASPTQKYVRVRQSCAASAGGFGNRCQPTRVYYCPDICHDVSVPTEDEAKRPSKAPSTVGRVSDSGNMSSEASENSEEEEGGENSSQKVEDLIRQLSEKLGEAPE